MNEPLRASADRLFTIQSPEAYDFQAGRSLRGEQMMMGLIDEGVMAIFFTASGCLLKYEIRPVEFDAAPDQPHIKRKEARGALRWSAFFTWAGELKFSRGEIKVFAFWLPTWKIGIAGLPDFWVRFLSNPLSESERRRLEWFKEIAQWQQEDKYILWWRTEYWMDKQGNVVST